MKEKIVEESILVVSIIKWIALASGIGALIGVATVAFLKILQTTISFAATYPYYFCLLPSGLFLSSILVRYVAREAKGYGAEKVIEAIHKSSGKIRAMVIPVKLVATVVTVGVGGSVAKSDPVPRLAGDWHQPLPDCCGLMTTIGKNWLSAG